MKKKGIIIAIACVAAFASCSKMEGRIDKHRKMDNVVMTENRYNDGALYYTTGTYISEKWNWDGKEMYRVDYYGDSPYSENFFYDNRRRIVRTTVPAYDISSEISYDGRNIDHIDVYEAEQQLMRMDFVRGEKSINEIVCTYYKSVDDVAKLGAIVRGVPVVSTLGAEVVSAVAGNDVRMMAQKGSLSTKSGYTVRYALTWKDDNIVRVVRNDGAESTVITLSYDDKNNPYSQLMGYRELDDALFGFGMLCENNVTLMSMPYENHGVVDFKYSYEYEDDYPVKRTLNYTYNMLSSETWDSVSIRVEKIETMNYMKD